MSASHGRRAFGGWTCRSAVSALAIGVFHLAAERVPAQYAVSSRHVREIVRDAECGARDDVHDGPLTVQRVGSMRTARLAAPAGAGASSAAGIPLYVGLQDDFNANGFWSHGEAVYWALDDGAFGPNLNPEPDRIVHAYQFAFGVHADAPNTVIQPYVIVQFYDAPPDPVGNATNPVVEPPPPASSIAWLFETLVLPEIGYYAIVSEVLDLDALDLEPFDLNPAFYVEIIPLRWDGGEPVFDPDVHEIFTGPGAVTFGANQDHMWSDVFVRDENNQRVNGDADFLYDHPAEMDAGGHAPFLNQAPLRLYGDDCSTLNRMLLTVNEPDDLCVQPGEQITVLLSMQCIAQPVRGYQAFLEFDNSVLSFGPGSYELPDPFGLPIITPIQAVGGDIDLAAGVDDQSGQEPASDSALLATLTFTANALEGPTTIGFRPHVPPSRFSDGVGGPVVPTLLDAPTILVDGTPPSLTCPPDVETHADAGLCTAGVDPGAPVVHDDLDDAPLIEYKRSDRANWNEGLHDPYPGGATTQIAWRVTDCAGNVSECTQTIEVSTFNELLVDVELSPTVSSPLVRCITFDVHHCGEGALTVEAELTFNDGIANDASILLPCGVYDCLTARDALHTLRRRDESFGVVGTHYEGHFTGDPDAGGDWLPGGDVNGDGIIDILDYSLFFSYYGQNLGSGDTDCDEDGPHPDLGGDGIVFTGDYTFISINFLESDEPGCCASPAP
jgi:hypothetical protein